VEQRESQFLTMGSVSPIRRHSSLRRNLRQWSLSIRSKRHKLGRVRTLWSGRMEAGENRIPMTSLSRRHGATLIVVQLDDGQTLSIPALALP